MALSKKAITDILFVIQVVIGFAFGGSQLLKMLTTTQGVSIAWYATWEVFLVLNLALSFRAHRVQPSRVTWQTCASYVVWVVMITLDLGVMLWRNSWVWTARDSITIGLVYTGVVGTLLFAYVATRDVFDPIVKGVLAVCFKGVPQLALAVNIWHLGGAGLSVVAIIGGHITICSRLGQVWYSYKEAGWDENRIGSAIGELANEFSWIVVTIAWCTV